MCAIFVVAHDLPVFLLVLQDLEVGEEARVAKRLGAVTVQLVDFLVRMIGLVQCKEFAPCFNLSENEVAV